MKGPEKTSLLAASVLATLTFTSEASAGNPQDEQADIEMTARIANQCYVDSNKVSPKKLLEVAADFRQKIFGLNVLFPVSESGSWPNTPAIYRGNKELRREGILNAAEGALDGDHIKKVLGGLEKLNKRGIRKWRERDRNRLNALVEDAEKIEVVFNSASKASNSLSSLDTMFPIDNQTIGRVLREATVRRASAVLEGSRIVCDADVLDYSIETGHFPLVDEEIVMADDSEGDLPVLQGRADDIRKLLPTLERLREIQRAAPTILDRLRQKVARDREERKRSERGY